jgi:FAD:protein FMN transferase
MGQMGRGDVDVWSGLRSRGVQMRPCLQILLVGLLLMRVAPAAAQERSDPAEDSQSLSRFEFLQIRMAIPVRITLYAPDEATANLASDRAYGRFKQLDRCLSDYDPDSELSVLCREAVPSRPRPVSEDLFRVLSAAEQFSRLSEGAFDVTVGPLTQLWRKARRRRQLPLGDHLRTALEKVGWQHVRLEPHKQSVDLAVAGMKLDLGGIAKGYAADEALRAMADLGVTSALIDAGGDVVAGDPPPAQSSWQIGIAPLEDPRGRPDRSLKLANAAVATSGDASQHVEIDGVRYSHIVDPQTGMGLTTLSSVTVIAPDGMTADALASALSVLGPQRGLELIERIEGAEAYVVTRDAAGVTQTHSSSGLADHFAARDQ